MDKIQVTHLLDEIDDFLDNKYHLGDYCFLVNAKEIQAIVSKIRHILPTDLSVAERINKQRDDIIMEAHCRSERIINEAQVEAARILSEHELIKTVQQKAVEIQKQLQNNCEEMKNKAEEESEVLKRNAYQEALLTKENAKAYAEELLANVERDIDKIHKHIKSCQEYLAKQKDNENSTQEARETYNTAQKV